MKTLGLIGGTTWLSTVEYYRLLNEGTNARLGGDHTARCVIHSFDFADITAINKTQDWDKLLDLTSTAAINLRNAGAEGIVLCANTLHVIADRLQERVGMPVIHIVDAVAADIRKRGIERVSLLGTRYTMELPFFKDRLAWHGIAADIPDKADRDFIQDTIFGELAKNEFRPATRDRYLSIIEGLSKQGARGSIMGCTEIPLLIKQTDTAVPLFDTIALHAHAAIEFALG